MKNNIVGSMPDILKIYEKLLSRFGEQNWWPAETPFEVVVGAILTQQTSWKNAELAIRNLKREGLLDLSNLAKRDVAAVEKCIRPSGFYRQKSKNLVGCARYIFERFGTLDAFFSRDADVIRKELLSLKGIGPETADSILLYAGDKPSFVVDAYTRRILSRAGIIRKEATGYDEVRRICTKALPTDVGVYKEFHALIVKLGKEHCSKKPVCEGCPIGDLCGH